MTIHGFTCEMDFLVRLLLVLRAFPLPLLTLPVLKMLWRDEGRRRCLETAGLAWCWRCACGWWGFGVLMLEGGWLTPHLQCSAKQSSNLDIFA